MKALALLFMSVLANSGCAAVATPPAPEFKSARMGPRPEGMDPLADPFANRRDVSSEPAVVVGGFGADCHAALFSGPRGCFVRGGRIVKRAQPPDDAGRRPADPEAAFEYWLECGAVDQPCNDAEIGRAHV